MQLPILPPTALGLLLIICGVGVLGQSTSSTATFLYPNIDGLIINVIDTVVLQWESNYATPWLQMWCQNGTAGNNVVLGSNFKVQSTGNFPFVMVDDDQDQTSFPVACHYQLATAQYGGGVDSPVGVTFVSLGSSAVGGAKTFSLSSTSTSISSSVTTTQSTSSPTTSPTTSLPSNTSPALATNSSTASAASTGTSMSGGAKAGIGIGIAVAVVGIVGAAAYIFRRRKSAQTSYGGLAMPELSSDDSRHEMAAPHAKHELYSDTIPGELSSNTRPENTSQAAMYEMAG